MLQIDKLNLAYLAGIVDGEGCIYAKYGKSKNSSINYQVKVEVELVNEPVIRLLGATFDGYVYKRSKKNRKDTYRWQAHGEVAYNAIKALYPYLIIKKPQAEVLLRLAKIHPKQKRYTPMERFLAEAEMKALKQLNN